MGSPGSLASRGTLQVKMREPEKPSAKGEAPSTATWKNRQESWREENQADDFSFRQRSLP